MVLQAPGFAGAWEGAKAAAAEELAAEDQGRSFPKRILTRLFGSSGGSAGGESALLAGSAPEAEAPSAPVPSAAAATEKPLP